LLYGRHCFGVGQYFHLLQQVGHLLPGYNEGNDLTIAVNGGGALFPA
jgi:hypothetical protein